MVRTKFNHLTIPMSRPIKTQPKNKMRMKFAIYDNEHNKNEIIKLPYSIGM